MAAKLCLLAVTICLLTGCVMGANDRPYIIGESAEAAPQVAAQANLNSN